jgi:transposase
MRSQSMSKKSPRKRRKFTREYKAEVVRLCEQPGTTMSGVAQELGLTPSAVSNWAQQATVDRGQGGGNGALTTEERSELSALRREVRTLRQERDILKRATAFFAKEGSS